jgi:hypothetical protein
LLPDATPSARKCSTVARSIQWSPDQEIVLSFSGHPPLDKHASLLYTMCFNIAVVDATLKLDSIDAIGYISRLTWRHTSWLAIEFVDAVCDLYTFEGACQ